jgi:hypothetical protein
MKDTPIFHLPFYLDAVAGDNWDVALVHINEQLVASMPYVIEKIKGYSNIVQPPLSQFGGPWFSKEYLKKNRVGREKQLMDELFAQLPPHSSYLQNWHHEITNWLPLYWKGFSQTTRYTYLIPDTSDLKSVWDNLQPNVKSRIRNSEKNLTVIETDDFDNMYRILSKSFQSRKKSGLFPEVQFKNLNEALGKNNSRKILIAEDSEKIQLGTAYFIWDEVSVYYLAGGISGEGKNTGIMQLLL